MEREPDLALDEELVCTQRRIAFKTALSYADKPQEIADREKDGLKLEELKHSASAGESMRIPLIFFFTSWSFELPTSASVEPRYFKFRRLSDS